MRLEVEELKDKEEEVGDMEDWREKQSKVEENLFLGK